MENIIEKIKDGSLVPFLGMGIFKNTIAKDGTTLPYDSDSMILALNNGRAMSPRLMYEYSRAAMSLEQRKGREFIIQMTNHIYSSKEYDLPEVYKWLSIERSKSGNRTWQRIRKTTGHFSFGQIYLLRAEYKNVTDEYIALEFAKHYGPKTKIAQKYYYEHLSSNN